MRNCARWLPLLAAMFTLSGCIYVGDWADSDAYRSDFHSTYPLSSGGRVSLESFDGSIDVIGWDQDSVEVSGTKHASTREAMEEIKIDIRAQPDSVRVRAIRDSGRFRHGGVRFSIRVPRKTLLELVSSSNGKLDIEDVEGGARLRTSNGAIRLVRSRGEIEAVTTNGSIDAQDVGGTVSLRTTNGSVRSETKDGSLEAATTNGSITARVSNTGSNSPVRLTSSNGRIELTVDSPQIPEVRVSTSNSSIMLRMPASASARLRASTSNHSSITSEFDDDFRGDRDTRRRHSDLEASIGHGGPLVDLKTSNGSIKIVKF